MLHRADSKRGWLKEPVMPHYSCWVERESKESSSRACILYDILKQQVSVRKFTSMVMLQHRYWPQAQAPATEGLQCLLKTGVFWTCIAQRYHVRLKTSKIRYTLKIQMSSWSWRRCHMQTKFNWRKKRGRVCLLQHSLSLNPLLWARISTLKIPILSNSLHSCFLSVELCFQ